MKCYVELKLDGKVVIPEFEAHSWTRAFLVPLLSKFSQANSSTATSILAIARTFGPTDQTILFGQNVIPGSNGIVIGTSSVAFDASQITLQARETAGWVFSASLFSAYTSIGGKGQWSEVRTCTNSTGAAVDIAEVGLYARLRSQTGIDDDFMIERTVLPSAVNVPNGSVLTVTYTIRGA